MSFGEPLNHLIRMIVEDRHELLEDLEVVSGCERLALTAPLAVCAREQSVAEPWTKEVGDGLAFADVDGRL